MQSSRRETFHFGRQDRWPSLVDDLRDRLAVAEAEREQLLVECEEVRQQIGHYAGECLCLEAELHATAKRLRDTEFALRALQRRHEEDRAAINLLERRLLTAETEAATTEEEFHATLEELQLATEELASTNLQLQNLNYDLEHQVYQRTAALEAAVADRDALIHEIHHQTRNNLQVISSLLNLQASRLKEPSAGEVRKSFRRIQTISLIHGLLFDGESGADVPVRPLLRTLCDHLTGDVPEPAAIDVRVFGGDGRVSLNTAGPLALMVAELVANALRHGFPDRDGGTVEVRVEGEPRAERIVVQDNGAGMDRAAAAERCGLGLLLVRSLARQIGAQVRLERRDGTAAEIVLP
jgi:two-component sensor histidine kinase